MGACTMRLHAVHVNIRLAHHITNAITATATGSIPASADILEYSEGVANKALLYKALFAEKLKH